MTRPRWPFAIASLALCCFLASTAFAAAKPDSSATRDKKKDDEEAPVVTHHQMSLGGKTLKYTVTAGMMPYKNAEGETEAKIFYMAYTLDREKGAADAARPLMFSFNGGPGSASVWLHLGALGPKRVQMQADGMMPSPPYQLVDNPYT